LAKEAFGTELAPIVSVLPEMVEVTPPLPKIFNVSPKGIVVTVDVVSTNFVEEFVKEELAIFDSVFVEPLILLLVNVSEPASVAKSASDTAVLNCAIVPVTVFVVNDIDLFVKVSVVALPTKVSVDIGSVIVPVLEIDEIIGVVKVLFVKVSVPVNVAKSPSLNAVLNCAVYMLCVLLVVGLANDVLLRSSTGELIVACDTSGSMGGIYPTVFGEIARIAQNVNPDSVRVIWWDCAVCGDQVFKPHEFDKIASLLKPAGGGGTSPNCVVEYIREKKYQPKGVVWLTDGYLDGSDGKVDVPALWGVVDNDHFVAPQGKTVRIYSN
jgi:hypothetical protein